jgi:hypothetical protein
MKVRIAIEADYPDNLPPPDPGAYDVRIVSTEDAYLDILNPRIVYIANLEGNNESRENSS